MNENFTESDAMFVLGVLITFFTMSLFGVFLDEDFNKKLKKLEDMKLKCEQLGSAPESLDYNTITCASGVTVSAK